MEAHSLTTHRSNRPHSHKCCHCGRPTSIKKSWTDKNPGRLFMGCDRYQEEDGCNFFEWYDAEEIKGWPKRSLIEARDEIRKKNLAIKRLNNTVATLRLEIENYRRAEEDRPNEVYSSPTSQNEDDSEPSTSLSGRFLGLFFETLAH
ncbi:hypothetical protein Rs2_05041 [Raphanus sativus]|uniref:Uncharacterized protein LOC108835404 n=1 Tax=Raphanus sativus TaxID=3726 RepID=A0A6J0LVE8_RAPSA|nr:uncharacterized protein LOC108835404 [Raphanus sativus]KAJ4910420.1 hypothetical protein Rs2_05041 [Raphanus sativus]